MNDQFDQIRKLFLESLDRDGLESQLAYSANRCGDDLDLQLELERMLRAHHDSSDFLGSKAGPTAKIQPITESPGTTIGPYKIREQLGEGGMGIVYAAEQEHPVRRKVALKLIKPGMDSREVIGRFEAERQALAMMDHQNIARVLDAGTTESGLPYFVMELVRGVTVTEYCDKNRLSVRDRLELFTQICKAVQHAHQKGIIHRDIKPSNVMVTLHDGVPVPKVIDFGVAKAINQRLTEGTVYTKVAQMLGTPAYMSPEQAELSGLDIDTRSDIYSLGVMLYELLTGSTPFTKEQLSHASFDEMRRVIRETDPQRPSERISTLKAQAISTVANNRNNDPRKLSILLRGELDWIVMKALEKDRSRRYETAYEFANDINRYLADEPVLARPATVTYRVSKFARRNKGKLTAVSIVVAIIAIGAVVNTWQGIRVSRAENRTEGVQRFFIDDILLQASPWEQKHDITMSQVLDLAAKKVNKRFLDEPLVEAEIRETLAKAFSGLGENEKAALQAERSLELMEKHLSKNASKTLSLKAQLAWSRLNANDLAPQVAVLEGLLKTCEQELGVVHEVTREVVYYLGRGYSTQGKLDLAEEQFVRLIDDSPDELQVIKAMSFLATVKQNQGYLDESLRLFEDSYSRGKKLLDDQDATLIYLRGATAGSYLATGDFEKALSGLQETLKSQNQILGPDHPTTLVAKANVATALLNLRQLKQAEQLFSSLEQQITTTFGANSKLDLSVKSNLVSIHKLQGRLAEAWDLANTIAVVLENRFRREPEDVLNAKELRKQLSRLAELSMTMGDTEKHLAIQEKMLPVSKQLARLLPDDIKSKVSLAGNYCNYGWLIFIVKKTGEDGDKANVAIAHDAMDNFNEAKVILEKLLAVRPDHVSAKRYLLNANVRMVDAGVLLGNYEEAIAKLDELVAGDDFFDWGYAASLYCRCASLARKNDQQGKSNENHQLAKTYEDQAMMYLRRYTKNTKTPIEIASGITSDSAFLELRDRDDFKALIEQLNSPSEGLRNVYEKPQLDESKHAGHIKK